MAASTDWSAWVRRWDDQQERYLPAREQCFALEEWQSKQLEGAEGYRAFRDALRNEPELRPLVEEGNRRFASKHQGTTLPVEFPREARLAAGFAEAGEIWRYHSDAILLALR